MIPEIKLPIILSECASTGCKSTMAEIPANALTNKTRNESLPLTSWASLYLHRVPSGSRQWKMYLHDLVESKKKQSQRVQKETESIDDFLKRFPTCETA